MGNHSDGQGRDATAAEQKELEELRQKLENENKVKPITDDNPGKHRGN